MRSAKQGNNINACTTQRQMVPLYSEIIRGNNNLSVQTYWTVDHNFFILSLNKLLCSGREIVLLFVYSVPMFVKIIINMCSAKRL